jgi:hypothetical protein
MRTRRRFSAEFKAKVALEAIKGEEMGQRPTWLVPFNATDNQSQKL